MAREARVHALRTAPAQWLIGQRTSLGRRGEWLIASALIAPLAIATVDPTMAAYAAALATVLVYVLKFGRRSADLVNWLAYAISAWVLLTPLWAFAPQLSGPASRGAAVSVIYFTAVRLGVDSRSQFRRILLLVDWTALFYAALFLTAGHSDTAGRLTLVFVNLNYTSAILAFGVAASVWIAAYSHEFARWQRGIAALGAVVMTVSIVLAGSRASLAGVVVAAAVVLLMRRAAKLAHMAMAVVLPFAAFLPYLPGADPLLALIARSAAVSRALTRSGLHITVLSGRDTLWASTKRTVSRSWLSGAGLDGYRLESHPPLLAHSWGLDALASVGVVGTALLVLLVGLSFLGRHRLSGSPARRPAAASITATAPRRLRPHSEADARWRLWNTASAASILPSMALSTHQWTLWAWAAIALWSRSVVLNETEPGAHQDTSPLRIAE